MAIGHFFTVIGPMLKSMSMRSSRGCLNGGCLKTSTCSTAYPVSVWVVWIIAPGRKLTSKVKAISRRDHTRVVLRRLSHCWNELVLVANCSSVDWRVECGGFNFTRKEESCLNIYIYIYISIAPWSLPTFLRTFIRKSRMPAMHHVEDLQTCPCTQANISL